MAGFAKLRGRSRPALPFSGSTVGRVGLSVDTAHGALQVHSSGRELKHADGKPFFWMGATVWYVPEYATLAELTIGFEVFRSLGINVVQMCCSNGDADIANRQGDVPFTGGSFGTPNDTYFTFVDSIVDLAATKGIYVALLPFWGGYQFWLQTERIDTITLGQCTSYGTYIGNRMKNKANVIWMFGGDSDVSGITSTTGVAARIAKWDALAAAIKATGDAHLMTFHHSSSWGFQRASFPTYDTPPFGYPLVAKSWLDFSTAQSWPSVRDIPAYNWVPAFFALSPLKPFLITEDGYEDSTGGGYAVALYDIRQRIYWSVFAGACGYTHGHQALWNWGTDPGIPGGNYAFWYRALSRPGMTFLKRVRDLIESRPYLDRLTDDTLVTSVSSGLDRIVGCKTAASCFIYIPRGAAFTATLGKISGASVKAYWFNPRTGAVTFINTYTNSSTQAFTPPTAGTDNDWVLILDDASMNFPIPGFGTYQ